MNCGLNSTFVFHIGLQILASVPFAFKKKSLFLQVDCNHFLNAPTVFKGKKFKDMYLFGSRLLTSSCCQ